MAPIATPAILLRAHDYGETSRILRFYTLEHGLLAVMARGVRGRSGKGATTLSTFATGNVTAYVRPQRDLHTMKDFECTHLRAALGTSVLRFAGASAVAELVVTHADQEPHPELFRTLESALDDLETAPESSVGAASLSGAWRIVDAFGFAPELGRCTQCGNALTDDEMGRFDFPAGGIVCERCGTGTSRPRVGPGARTQILALLAGNLGHPLTYPRRHLALLSDFVAFHIAQKPLKTLRFLGDLLPANGTAEGDGP